MEFLRYTSFAKHNKVSLKQGISANLLADWYVLRPLTKDILGPGHATTVQASIHRAQPLSIPRQFTYGIPQQNVPTFDLVALLLLCSYIDIPPPLTPS